MHMWRSKDNLVELVLSFHLQVGSGKQAQSPGLHKCAHLPTERSRWPCCLLFLWAVHVHSWLSPATFLQALRTEPGWSGLWRALSRQHLACLQNSEHCFLWNKLLSLYKSSLASRHINETSPEIWASGPCAVFSSKPALRPAQLHSLSSLLFGFESEPRMPGWLLVPYAAKGDHELLLSLCLLLMS